MPHGLHLDYDLDFQTRRVDDVAPALTSPLLSGLVGNIRQFERLGIPGEPTSFKVDEDLWSHSRAPPKPDLPGPSHDEGTASKRPASEGEARGTEPPGQGESPQGQPPSEPDQEEIIEIVDSEEDDLTTLDPQAPPRQEVNRPKAGRDTPEDWSPHPLPSKKQATGEEEKSTPQWEAALPRGMKEEDLLLKRHETFTMDNN